MDLASAPQFQGVGADWDALMKAADSLDPDAPLPRKRVSDADAYKAFVDEEHDELATLSALIPGTTLSSKRVGMQTLWRFIQWHKLHYPPTATHPGGEFTDRERDAKSILLRIKQYMTWLVLRSQRVDRETGKALLHADTGKPIYMQYATATVTLRSVVALLRRVPVPPLSFTELEAARRELSQHHHTLRLRFDLRTPIRDPAVFYPADVRTLIEHAWETAAGEYDSVVQWHALLLAFQYTGARPGSLLSTKHYRDEYAQWEDVAFEPHRVDKQTVGFNVLLPLKAFKGYHNGSRLRVIFRINTTMSARFAISDFGTAMMAHAVRSGVFGEQTLDDLLSFEGTRIRCNQSHAKLPIFRSRLPKGTGLHPINPMRDQPANRWLQRMLRELGMPLGTKYSNTVYAMRRAFATLLPKNYDRATAKSFMGHKPGSYLLESLYDKSGMDLNLAEGILGPDEQAATVITPASLKRSANPTIAPKVTLAEAVRTSPTAQSLLFKRDLLKRCMQSGSAEWLQVEPYKALRKNLQLSNALLPLFIKRLTRRLISIVDSLRTGVWASAEEQNTEAANETSDRLIEQRRRASENASDLADDLLKRLAVQEKELAKLENTAEEEDEELEFMVPSLDNLAGDTASNSLFGDGESERDASERDEAEDEAESEDERDDDEQDEDMDATEGSQREQYSDNDPEGASLIQDVIDATASAGSQPLSEDEGEELESDSNRKSDVAGAAIVKQSDKLSILRAATSLAQRGEHTCCPLCIGDPHATTAEKAMTYPPSGAKLRGHIASHHSCTRLAMRWIHRECGHGQKKGPLDCPFAVNEGAPDVEDGYADREHLNSFLHHLMTAHRDALPEALLPALDPDTRAARRESDYATSNELSYQKQQYSSKSTYSLRLQAAFGTMESSDDWGVLGLIDGVLQTSELSVDFKTDLIPVGFLFDGGDWSMTD